MSHPTSSRPEPLDGQLYVNKLLKFLSTNKARLALPPHSVPPGGPGNIWQQSYTLLTLGLDPTSSPLSLSLSVPLTLGFGTPPPTPPKNAPNNDSNLRPLTLRLPPDRLLYLLLLFQSSSTPSLSSSPIIGRTDIPVPPGVQLLAAGPGPKGSEESKEGDVKSVRSWVGSLRSVGGVFGGSSSAAQSSSGWGWFGSKKEVMDEDAKLRTIYGAFTILPSLIIHPPSQTEPLIRQLVEESAYTSLGGIDVRVPLSVFRGLWALELEGYDPRGIYIPEHPGLKSLTVRNVQDGDDWLSSLLTIDSSEIPTSSDPELPSSTSTTPPPPTEPRPRFPSLRYLSLPSTSLFTLPNLPVPLLTHLDLSSNLLNAIPPSLSLIHTLQSLNLSNNMIDSVRGANLILGQVHVLNLRNNRIDCLSGLDRVLGLERLDLRKNHLLESAEVGRLATLPLIKEIWVGQANDFLDIEEDWRQKLFITFAEEGKEDIKIDGTGPSWTEERTVQAELLKRGRRAASRHRPAAVAGQETPGARTRPSERRAAGKGKVVAAPSPLGKVGSDSASIGSAQPSRPTRRRNQRIVNLDGSVHMESGSEEESGGGGGGGGGDVSGPSGASTSVPPSSRPGTKEVSPSPIPSTARRKVAAPAPASIPPPTSSAATNPQAAGESPEDFRKRMEALKLEVGDSWLKVLAQTQGQPPVRGRAVEPAGNGAGAEVTEGAAQAIKVAPRKGKKKKANAEIT